MSKNFIFLFDTALGRAGVCWSASGLRAVAFPGLGDDQVVEESLRKRGPYAAMSEAPAQEIVCISDGIAALLRGEDADFNKVRLDDADCPEFDRAVWALARQIPRGCMKTYGDLAKALGDVSLSRRVGQALGRNPFPIIVPCHRIVGASGEMTGFSAPGGAESKRRLLKIEGALAPDLFDLR